MIYTPSKTPDKVTTINAEQLLIKKIYAKSWTKAKIIQFSNYKKQDPVLSKFNEVEEVDVP